MFVQQIINGLTLGMTYALIAVGYSLVFGILRLVNFSHGAVYAFGANAILFGIGLQFGLWPAIIIGILATGILGVLVDKVALEPLRKKKAAGITSLITTIGVSSIITNLLIAQLGSQKRSFPSVFPEGVISFGTYSITYTQIGMLLVSLILLLGLMVLVNKTKIGLAMRACEQNIRAAQLMGINTNFIISFTFFLGGISAAIAGTLVSGYYSMAYPNMGYMAGLKAFAAAVLGGIGSLPGSLLGGLVVGVSESIAATFLGSEFRDSIRNRCFGKRNNDGS
ncbi:MAG: branched-chain amino acid ABC transporter permease [Peptoniphilaceae bacterium]|nr:branched-chain amino acid ABC transporter permease [Peptoniphilaceae bacterium]MDY3076440.1 branched-chain amino acid ABC transporter permease [Peptoniphilaceae bacterium]